MSGKGFIKVEEPQQCDDCGELKELRPYGPGGKCICYSCAQNYPVELIEENMVKHLGLDE